jgi:hypothetical protein
MYDCKILIAGEPVETSARNASSCDKGLNHMTCDAPLLGPMAELWLVPHDISP